MDAGDDVVDDVVDDADAACFMKLLVDANSDGGALLGIMPEQSCVQQCLDRYPECVAVDYRSADQNCYWHNVGTGVQWNDCCNRYQITCERTYTSPGTTAPLG